LARTKIIGFRLPDGLLKRIDRVRDRMSRDKKRPITRAEVVKELLEQALSLIEAESIMPIHERQSPEEFAAGLEAMKVHINRMSDVIEKAMKRSLAEMAARKKKRSTK